MASIIHLQLAPRLKCGSVIPLPHSACLYDVARNNCNFNLISYFVFCWPYISIQLCNENQLDAQFLLSLFRQSISACFGHICSPSSGGILYIYNNWYVLCFSVDCLLAGLRRNFHFNQATTRKLYCVYIHIYICIYTIYIWVYIYTIYTVYLLWWVTNVPKTCVWLIWYDMMIWYDIWYDIFVN
jgi:hypothetical protein